MYVYIVNSNKVKSTHLVLKPINIISFILKLYKYLNASVIDFVLIYIVNKVVMMF